MTNRPLLLTAALAIGGKHHELAFRPDGPPMKAD